VNPASLGREGNEGCYEAQFSKWSKMQTLSLTISGFDVAIALALQG
jgi:hypothetical protein